MLLCFINFLEFGEILGISSYNHSLWTTNILKTFIKNIYVPVGIASLKMEIQLYTFKYESGCLLLKNKVQNWGGGRKPSHREIQHAPGNQGSH